MKKPELKQYAFVINPWLSMTVWGSNEMEARHKLLKFGVTQINKKG